MWINLNFTLMIFCKVWRNLQCTCMEALFMSVCLRFTSSALFCSPLVFFFLLYLQVSPFSFSVSLFSFFFLALRSLSDLLFISLCRSHRLLISSFSSFVSPPFSPPPPLPLPQTYFSLTSLHQFICSVIWVFVNKNKNGKMRKVKWKKNKVKTVKLKTHNRNFPFSASGLF